MGRIHPECPDSDPPEWSVTANVRVREEPDEEENEVEEEDDGKTDDDDDDENDDGHRVLQLPDYEGRRS